jgi:hypothetical protein
VTSKNKPRRSPVVAPNDERIPAAVDLLGRTGADEVQLRYSDDEKPVVWMAIARWRDRWEAAAAMTPARALFRLLDEVVDGGQCQHCNRPTGFSPDLDALPLDALICWYQWDPELRTFRRGCAGDG